MLARTFLRLAALEAVRPSALLASPSPAWPTLARDFVFDSKLDPVSELSDDDARLVAVIYTDGNDLVSNSQAGPFFYASTVDLVIEIAAVARLKDDAGGYVAGFAVSDAELDADLDALEQQVWWQLHVAETGKLFRSMIKQPFVEWRSDPRRSSEEGQRLASRTIGIKVDLKEQCFNGSPAADLVGLDRLPPVLRAVAEGLAESTYLRDIANAVADVMPAAPVLPRLNRVAGEIKASETVEAVPADIKNLDT